MTRAKFYCIFPCLPSHPHPNLHTVARESLSPFRSIPPPLPATPRCVPALSEPVSIVLGRSGHYFSFLTPI